MWRNVSVHVCLLVTNTITSTHRTNHRHVSKTGDIKDFVITEESGIAKGIRQVVAVTGHEAAEVKRVAENLSARLDQLDAMQGKEKDTGLKAYQVVRTFDSFGGYSEC